MLVSSVITAAGRNLRMEKSQTESNLPIKNKLLLPFPYSSSEKTIIEVTISNILSTDVDECIIVLGHFADKIREVIDKIDDGRIKIIENQDIDVGLNSSLLNGFESSKNNYVLSLAADQPTVSTKTYNNIIKSLFNLKNPDKSVSILRRLDFGFLNTAKGLGMPFIANKNEIIPYLQGKNDNLNPILREMFDEGFCFYGVKEENEIELININNMDDYNFILDKFNSL